MGVRIAVRSISANNTFTDRVQLAGYFNVSISGTWSGAVTCQRSFDQGSTWFDVKDWDENIQEYGFEPERGVWYQIGFKDGGYDSGTATLRLSQ
jgi:hypothetical protein